MNQVFPDDANKYTEDVELIKINGKSIFLIGTAHISQKSADLVREVITNEKPDRVCVELDEQRFKALSQKKKWEDLDIKKVIKDKQLSTLLINILLASYQKKLGEKIGVNPGVELMEAVNAAKESEIPISLSDRDIRITLRRAWNSMSLWQKLKLLGTGAFGIFEKQEISEEQLAEIKKKDVLNEMMRELGKALPVLKTVLIDERDKYLAQKIKESKGERIVAVVGAGHVNGIKEILLKEERFNLEEIEEIPPVSKVWKTVGWAIPMIIIASLFYIGYSKGSEAASENIIFWILANGIPSFIGAIIALAHPFAILSAFLAAPFTSLTPVIGAGYVVAFVQAYFQPPKVKEFSSVSDDVGTVRMWWKNRLLKILLVFILAGLGSAIGTYVGAFEIIRNVLN